jgi:hypothetical protein
MDLNFLNKKLVLQFFFVQDVFEVNEWSEIFLFKLKFDASQDPNILL